MIARHMFPAAVLLAVSTLLPTADAQGPRQLKIISVADILSASNPPLPPRIGSITNANSHEDQPTLLARGRFVCAHAGEFLEFVRLILADDEDDVSLVLRDESLLVTGKPDQVARVQQIVNGIRQVITRRLTVRARLYRIASKKSYPASATMDQLRTLTKDLEPVWSGQAKSLSGQQVAMTQSRFTRYVCGVDIEVAEEVSVARPVTGSVFEGIRLVVESHSLVGTGDRVFKCQFAIGENESPIQLQSTGSVRALPRIGIPNVRATSGSFSGRVSPGGALLVTVQSRNGAGSNFLLVVQSEVGQATATPIIAGNVLILPISALTTTSMRHGLPELGTSEDDPEGDHGGYPDIDGAVGKKSDRGDSLRTLLRESLGDLLDEEGSGLDVLTNGVGHGYLFLQGSDALRTSGSRLLASIQDLVTQGIETHVRTELHDASNADSPFTRIESDSGGEFLHSLTYPTLLGDSSIVFKGLESAVIRDYFTEIAKKATLSKPAVQTTFRGIIAAVHPSMRDQGVGAEFRSTVTEVRPLSRQASPESSVGEIHHIQVDKAEFRHSGPVQLDAVAPLGYGPTLRSETHNFRMHQTVRFRKL